MKMLFIWISFTAIALSFPGSFSGMYFEKGATITGKYLTQKEDENRDNGIGLGVSYLIPQKANNNLDRPTLLSNGTVEINSLYTRVESDDEGLHMDLLSAGVNCYMQNNIKFGFQYESLINFGGDLLDQANDDGMDLDVNSTSSILSVGYYDNQSLPVLVFLDYLSVTYDFSTTISVNGTSLMSAEDTGGTNLIRLGMGYKKNNLIIQPTFTLNEDSEKRFAINLIYKL